MLELNQTKTTVFGISSGYTDVSCRNQTLIYHCIFLELMLFIHKTAKFRLFQPFFHNIDDEDNSRGLLLWRSYRHWVRLLSQVAWMFARHFSCNWSVKTELKSILSKWLLPYLQYSTMVSIKILLGNTLEKKIIFLIDEHHYLTMHNDTYRIILASTLNVHILNSFQCKT